MNFINFLWSAPLQIIISLFFLYNEIGWAAFMALVVMVLIAPLSMFFTTKVSALLLLVESWANENWTNLLSGAITLIIDEKRSGSNDESKR